MRVTVACVLPTTVNEIAEEDFFLSPTVSENEFILQISSDKFPITLQVFEASGRLVQQWNNVTENRFGFGNNLAAGSYFVKIIGLNKSGYFKIIRL